MIFQVMELEVHPVLGGKFSEEQAAVHQTCKEYFLEKLDCNKGGTDLIKSIYALLDELTAEFLKENPVSCRPGCAWCCQQLVCCTTLEMEVIIEYLESLPRPARRQITKQAKKESLKFKKFYENNDFGGKRLEKIAPDLREFHYLRPCLYLSEKKMCHIYRPRPIDCRIAKTKGFCGHRKEGEEKPKSIRLFLDQVASDLIMEEEKKIYGKLEVVPLIMWPLTGKFAEFFF